MKVYRLAWVSCCGLLGVVGIVVALMWELGLTIAVAVLIAFVGGVFVWVALDPEGSTRPSREVRRIVVSGSVLMGLWASAFVVLTQMLGLPAAALLLVMVGGGSPRALHYGSDWLRERGHLPTPSAEPVLPDAIEAWLAAEPEPTVRSEPPASVVPLEMTDQALCLAWRTSFSALQRATSASEQLHVIEARRAYLDEIERRNARGMAAWLASGARAAGDPSRYVLGDAAGRTFIDWDDLLHDLGR